MAVKPRKHTSKGISLSVSPLDAPPPAWFLANAALADSWPLWIVTAAELGARVSVSDGDVLSVTDDDLYFLLSGCFVVTSEAETPNAKPFFIEALRRGDLIMPIRHAEVGFVYQARSHAEMLRISGKQLTAFLASLPNGETGLLAGEIHLLSQLGIAAKALFLSDEDRILRVAGALASHPEVPKTASGALVASNKEELRALACVDRKAGIRAFKALNAAGLLIFEGYKKFFYRETPAT